MPNYSLISVGKLTHRDPEYAVQQRYLKRLSGLKIITVKEGRSDIKSQRLDQEAKGITTALGKLSPAVMIALDERGRQMTSPDFAKKLTHLTREYGQTLCFIIGGAYGLAPHIIQQSTLTLSLGPMTLPHRLAQVILLEQLYRAHTILAGHPYHKP